ncbi:MAG: hypothetical protein IPM79_05105 [Polyangiaceae bacterium]|nr:hypothetical protein [Polyangiaceae bacterium]
MRSAPLLLAALLWTGCPEERSGTGGSTTGGAGSTGGGASGGGGSAGDPECVAQACGEPCFVCDDCGQQICDGYGVCRPALEVLCSPCPAELPGMNDACSPNGVVCELEGGPAVDCRARAACTSQGWEIASAPFDCAPSPLEPAGCPEVQPNPGAPCDVQVDPAVCEYEVVLCGCTNCLSGTCGGSGMWACTEPVDPPCPEDPPQLGQSCFEPNLECRYGACWLEAAPASADSSAAFVTTTRACSDGLWREVALDCP